MNQSDLANPPQQCSAAQDNGGDAKTGVTLAHRKPGANQRLRQLPPARVEGKFELEIILRLKRANKGKM